ncbi:hypothetical protein HELRODRAFT_88068 [Helobdella robusta]|uniref:CHHC U11-48K-type domain-containing protein n=1 Tax=Helobdella robusta TaxID=6412 RepID=T1G6Y0_HELRO|nr:hypothetical protein HELRODRAFT_88068 [Helobdella robusta]ESN93881.1 hypothetical protein HELRODRAFT_88068 [Helobdella robusta]
MKKADEIATCPYNPEHKVLRSRLSYHIVKCQKTYIGEPKKTCPFNALHIIPASSFELHLQVCPDNVGLDRNIFMSKF